MVGLRVNEDLVAAADVQLEAHFTLGDIQAERIVVERLRLADVVDGEAGEYLCVSEYGFGVSHRSSQ